MCCKPFGIAVGSFNAQAGVDVGQIIQVVGIGAVISNAQAGIDVGSSFMLVGIVVDTFTELVVV